jgi:hypothetical protein
MVSYVGGKNEEGQRHGEGVWKTRDGTTISGTWKNGKLHGQATETLSMGVVELDFTYSGEWVEGDRQGKGVQTWGNGNTYSGEWVWDEPHGKGTYEWKNGDVFTGESYWNCRYGEGTFHWADGMTYTGKWDFNGTYYRGFDHLSAQLKERASLLKRQATLDARYFLVSLRRRDEEQRAIAAPAPAVCSKAM